MSERNTSRGRKRMIDGALIEQAVPFDDHQYEPFASSDSINSMSISHAAPHSITIITQDRVESIFVVPVDVNRTTVADLQVHIQVETGVPANEHILCYDDFIIPTLDGSGNDTLLCEYGISDNDVIGVNFHERPEATEGDKFYAAARRTAAIRESHSRRTAAAARAKAKADAELASQSEDNGDQVKAAGPEITLQDHEQGVENEDEDVDDFEMIDEADSGTDSNEDGSNADANSPKLKREDKDVLPRHASKHDDEESPWSIINYEDSWHIDPDRLE